jgi:hypothetical protein
VDIHVPTYDFERPIEAARREIWRLGIPYPVALGHGREVFRAYGLGDLPARVLVDRDGFVRGFQQGAADLGLLERALRSLLADRAGDPELPPPLAEDDGPPGPGRLRWRPTPEIRFGTRGVGFGPPDARESADGTVREFPEPPELRAEGVAYPRGRWRLGRERIVADAEDAGLSVVYEGASVSAVLSAPDARGEGVEALLAVDGYAPPAEAQGADVARSASGDDASLVVDRGGLYELISARDFGIHHLDLRIRGPGVAVHLLHFGTTDVPDVA